MSLRESIHGLPAWAFSGDGVTIRPIRDDDDLWYATVECRLAPGQEEFVNPAGFSVGRAYLEPEENAPCVICREDGQRIGYLVLRSWKGPGGGNSWSYYLDRDSQGQGYGTKAARLAAGILKAAEPDKPVKLAVDPGNANAQRVYQQIGFCRTDEMDGDEQVFCL